jgi:glutathione-regulated potassium-efflux system ancillary protein KefG
MAGTVILKFHPGYQPSKVNAAMSEAVAALEGVETIDMYALYPREDDLKAAEDLEVARLYAAERLCVQFPVHWFAATPRAMGWQDLVLNRMVFTHPEEGERVKGLPFMIAATAGQSEESYGRGHANMYPLGELMRPWEVTAKQSGFAWQEPFFAYGADEYDDDDRARVARAFAERIAAWDATKERNET